jgi:hypothetical protein
MYSKNSFIPHYQKTQLAWVRYLHILRLLYNRHDLEQLVAWARRKRLMTTVGRAYQRQLSDTEMDLAMLTVHTPTAARWARLLYGVNTLIAPSPRYAKGYAAHYRLR